MAARLLGLLLAGLFAAGTAHANSWTNAGSGFWHVGANWDNGSPPGAADVARITNVVTKTVTIDATTTTGANTNTMTVLNLRLWAPSSTVTNTLSLANAGTAVPLRVLGDFTMDTGGVLLMSNSALRVDGGSGGIFTLDAGSVTLVSGSISNTPLSKIGRVGQGSLTLSGGTVRVPDLIVSELAGSQGTLSVQGGAVTIVTSLVVGDAPGNSRGTIWLGGTGVLQLTNRISFARIGDDGNGLLIVSNGTFSAYSLVVGYNGTAGAAGTMTIAGGTSLIGSNFDIGDNANTTGTVWVTGGQLTATGEITRIGNSGVGAMTISNGTAFLDSVSVGRQSGARGTLTIAGGTLQQSAGLFIGRLAGASGAFWMTGSGNLIITDSTWRVGAQGNGIATVSNGTALVRDLIIGEMAGSAGTLTIAGGTVNVQTNVWIGTNATANATFNLTGGLLSLPTGLFDAQRGTATIGGGELLVNRLRATNTASVAFNTGTIDSSSTIVSNGAQFVVGNGINPATYRLNGGFHTFPNGLRIQVNGQLTGCGTVTGDVLNAGTITLDCPGSLLTFTGSVTNNGTLRATNAGTLEFYGTVVNNGTLDFTGSYTNFHGAFINNGTVIGGTPVVDYRITGLNLQGNNAVLTWVTAGGKTNIVQTVTGASFTTNFLDLATNIIVGTGQTTTNFIHVGGATNRPARFYRVRVLP